MRRSTGKHPRCPFCALGGYRQGTAYDGRPMFTCERCGHVWSQGKSGGKYALHNSETAPEETE